MHQRQYWWVSQGATLDQTAKDNIVRAPQTDNRGRAWFYWDNVAKIKQGDVLFHYADGAIRAVSIATSDGQAASAPEPRTNTKATSGRTVRERNTAYTAKREWRATIDAHVLAEPLPIKTFGAKLAALNLEKGPVNHNGGANPGFLYELTSEAVERIVEDMHLDGLPKPLTSVLADWKLDINEPTSSIDGMADAWHTAVAEAGLTFSRGLLMRFVAALLTKRFIILSGLSGSGKTRLAQAFARWITPDPACYSVVAVGADWTSNEAILGYADRLNGGYARTPVLSLLLHAHYNPHVPHVLVLDEMNLSHVERYFADVLSVMESGEPMRLHAGPNELEGVPPALALPENVFIIGTVNVDETTYLFSPKVLDRANVIEFRAGASAMASFLERANADADFDAIAHRGARFGQAFIATALDAPPALAADEQQRLRDEVLLVFDVLAAHHAEFGFRTANEMARFASHYKVIADNDDWFDAAIDAQLMQKVLPRLNGARAKLGPVLWSLGWVCRATRPSAEEILAQANDEPTGDDPATASRNNTPMRYPSAAAKLARMWTTLDQNGFVSFLEA